MVISAEQYKNLLLMSYLGNWIVNAHRVEADEAFEAAASRIYFHAKSAGAGRLVERDAESGRYYPTCDLEELAHPWVDAYDNETFWDELIDRLSERDLVAKHGRNACEQMTIEERFGNLEEFETRYGEEFENHGSNADDQGRLIPAAHSFNSTGSIESRIAFWPLILLKMLMRSTYRAAPNRRCVYCNSRAQGN
jgi:hypothetical protein